MSNEARAWADAIRRAEGKAVEAGPSNVSTAAGAHGDHIPNLPPASANVAFESVLPVSTSPALSSACEYEYSLLATTPYYSRLRVVSVPNLPSAAQLAQLSMAQALSRLSSAAQLAQLSVAQALSRLSAAAPLARLSVAQALSRLSAAAPLARLSVAQALSRLSAAALLARLSVTQAWTQLSAAASMAHLSEALSLTQLSAAVPLAQLSIALSLSSTTFETRSPPRRLGLFAVKYETPGQSSISGGVRPAGRVVGSPCDPVATDLSRPSGTGPSASP